MSEIIITNGQITQYLSNEDRKYGLIGCSTEGVLIYNFASQLIETSIKKYSTNLLFSKTIGAVSSLQWNYDNREVYVGTFDSKIIVLNI